MLAGVLGTSFGCLLICWSACLLVAGCGVGCYIVSTGHGCMHGTGLVWLEEIPSLRSHPGKIYEYWTEWLFLSYSFKIFGTQCPVGGQDNQPDGHGHQHQQGGGGE